MKLAILFSLFSLAAFGQYMDATVTLPDPSTQEWALSTTYKATSFPNTIAYIEAAPPVYGAFPNVADVPNNTTLAAAITENGTHALCATYSVTGASANAVCDHITLTDTTNLAQCNGLKIGSEMLEVYAVSGPTVTVIRGTVGTTEGDGLDSRPGHCDADRRGNLPDKSALGRCDKQDIAPEPSRLHEPSCGCRCHHESGHDH